MNKQYQSPAITEHDVQDYFDNHSDFGFEVKVRDVLVRAGASYSHGGTYSDPTTGLRREFDFRVVKQMHRNPESTCTLYMAIECKNLRSRRPLVITTMPRSESESNHSILERDKYGTYQILKYTGSRSAYPVNMLTGKNLVQIFKKPDGSFDDGDEETYRKWSQAVQHTEAMLNGEIEINLRQRLAFVPVLVVPEGCLWVIDCTEKGERLRITNAKQCSYYIGANLPAPKNPTEDERSSIRISHLEFMTPSGLMDYFQILHTQHQFETSEFFPATSV